MDKVLLFIEVLIGAFSQMWLALLCLIGIIIGLFIAFGIPFFLIWHLAEYMLQKPDEEYRDLPKLEFKQFYDFYSLSPNTWVIEEDYVIKLEDKDYEEDDSEPLAFTFVGCEYRKYMRFYNKMVNEAEMKRYKARMKRKQKHDNQQTIKLLEAVQEEINTMKAQSVREIDESAKTMMEIQDRIVGG